jgi:hypothetical protein
MANLALGLIFGLFLGKLHSWWVHQQMDVEICILTSRLPVLIAASSPTARIGTQPANTERRQEPRREFSPSGQLPAPPRPDDGQGQSRQVRADRGSN